MNSKKLFSELALKITLQEPAAEINQLVLMLMEHVFGLTQTQVLLGHEVPWNNEQRERLMSFIDRLNREEPIQYILGEAFFCGRKFIVNRSVLIPRPETEELIEIVRPLLSGIPEDKISLLEIGTGSGSIPITLQLLYPKANFYATDISEDALHIARTNAREWKAVVNFIRHDILTEEIPFTSLDLIVSNPPYIAQAEEHTLADNVRKHEPHLALFAAGDDPLIFYRNIARKAKKALRPGGYVAVEINERFGEATAELFEQENYDDIRIIRDISGKHRIVTAT